VSWLVAKGMERDVFLTPPLPVSVQNLRRRIWINFNIYVLFYTVILKAFPHL